MDKKMGTYRVIPHSLDQLRHVEQEGFLQENVQISSWMMSGRTFHMSTNHRKGDVQVTSFNEQFHYWNMFAV